MMSKMTVRDMASNLSEDAVKVREFILSSLGNSYENWCQCHRSGSCNNFAEFIAKLQPFERKKFFSKIEEKLIFSEEIHLTDHFIEQLLSRFHDHFALPLCKQIRNCVELALRYKKETSYNNGLFVVVGYKGLLPSLITLYQATENSVLSPNWSFYMGKNRVKISNTKRFCLLQDGIAHVSKVRNYSDASSPFFLPVR